ncbi:MAG: pyridoxal-dependent decarboxylase [Cyanobacteria bacterium J06592_8]
MTKLRSKLASDYASEGQLSLKKTIGKLLGDRVRAKLTAKKPATDKTTQDILGGENETDRAVAAWFLGPRGENVDLFADLVSVALNDHVFWRRNFHPSDPSPITENMKREPGYLDAVDLLKTEFYNLLAELKKSGPFASMRYQGHMTWDQTMPGMAGYFAAMLYNQNNVALEASPITTVLEVEACKDLCRMLGYRETTPKPWGHLTCGGSTANIEALWAARNLKFYPPSLYEGLKEVDATVAATFEVTLPDGTIAKMADLDIWQMLNLPVDEVLDLYNRLVDPNGAYKVDPVELNNKIAPYSLQNIGFLGYAKQFLTNSNYPNLDNPVILVPASKHYSLPKGAAILGLGADNMLTVPLDVHGRMDVDELTKAIAKCVSEKRPIIAIVAVFGTTEEGCVDSLKDVLDLRNENRSQNNLEFAVHADGAWGGYFAALLWDGTNDDSSQGAEAGLPMSDYVIEQYKSLGQTDTITIDPHKTGYLPYPAGALCYRNMTMRSLIAFEAPYINTGDDNDTPDELVLGTYGIEGSKPGAAAAGVYLSHAAIPLTRQGYGKILGRTIFNCKAFHLALCKASLESEEKDGFIVVPTPKIELSLIQPLLGKTPKEILNDSSGALLNALRQTGSDLNLITYAFNYKVNGVFNSNLAEVNAFNKLIYDHVSVKADGRDIYNYEILLSTTDFVKEYYGEVFFNDYRNRLLKLPETAPDNLAETRISVMRSTIMDPWITEDLNGTPFVEYIVAKLFDIVREVVAEVRENPALVSS